MVIGWVFVALGIAGMLFPVVPGVPFLIVALWAFSRSSQRFHDWLLNHRYLGPPVRRWQEGHVIPLPVKMVAVLGMGGSFSYLAFFMDTPWYVLAVVGILMVIGAVYILRCPSQRPQPAGARPLPACPPDP